MGAKRSTSLFAVAIIAGAVAGCGSSSKSSGTIPKADFIKRVDAICGTYNAQTRAIPFPNVDPNKATKAQLPQFAATLNKLSSLLHAERSQIAAVPKPDKDAALFAQGFAGFQAQISPVDKAAAAASSGNPAAFRAAAKALNGPPPGSAQARAAVKKFGLKVCGARRG
jgi:hypothetical protein